VIRIFQWVLGEDWGVRSLDGYAPADSAENRTNIAMLATLFATCGSALILVALATIPLARQRVPGFHLGWALALYGIPVLVLTPALWLTVQRMPLWSPHPIGVFLAGGLAAQALALGPELSPLSIPGYIVMGMAAFIALQRRAAAVQVVALATSYGVVVAYQRGNAAPFTRWLVLVGGMVGIGGTVAWLVERVRRLAQAEQRARAAVEAAQSELAEVNRTLEERVADQVEELERLGRLRRFLSTPVADAVLTSGDERLLEPHRREIAVFFCDLRGFTAFAASAQPEEVLGVLDEYFALLGELIQRHEATVGAFTGDGLMAFFNDPLPCPDPAVRAITMAVELQPPMESHLDRWRRHGYDLGFGIGIALGYASIGIVGFEGRRDYSALGPVVNLAARLCGEAQSGQILIDQRAHAAAETRIEVVQSARLALKGFRDPVPVFSVAGVTSD
jgi:class 3 adenylate cyclase